MCLQLTASRDDNIIFFSLTRRSKSPEIGHICEMAHLWCGNKLDYSPHVNNGKNTSVWTVTFKELLQWEDAAEATASLKEQL